MIRECRAYGFDVSQVDLQSILSQHLSIQVECLTDALHRSPLFPTWNLVRGLASSNRIYRGKVLSLHIGMSGRSARGRRHGLMSFIACSKTPTRFVLVIPVSYAEHILGIKNRKVLELARIPSGFQLTASSTLKAMEPCPAVWQNLSL